MEVVSYSLPSANSEDLSKRDRFIEHIDLEEDIEEGKAGQWMREGGRMLGGSLVDELRSEVEIFNDKTHQELIMGAGKEFPPDSGWEIPIKNEGRIFRAGIIANKNNGFINKLKMVNYSSQNRLWTDDLNKVNKETFNSSIAYMVDVMEKDLKSETAVDMRINRDVNKGMKIPVNSVLPLLYLSSRFIRKLVPDRVSYA